MAEVSIDGGCFGSEYLTICLALLNKVGSMDSLFTKMARNGLFVALMATSPLLSKRVPSACGRRTNEESAQDGRGA